MRNLVVELIRLMQKGQIIVTGGVYSGIYTQFPNECNSLGYTPSKPVEEKWKKDIRFGLQDAKDQGLVEHVGSQKSGRWERI
jgi:hypothetical protein